MDQPSGGKVWLGETEITGLKEDEKSRLRLHRMGFVLQQMNMMANLNILDKKLNREGTAVLLVTHDAGVACHCDRLLYLLDGQICGELNLGRPSSGEEKQRRGKVDR